MAQNNEAEALRSWRNALDQIYYHNAYRMPSAWRPKSETERALQDSLRQMEVQCKERVDLLEALQESRKEAANTSQTSLTPGLNNQGRALSTNSIPLQPRSSHDSADQGRSNSFAGGSIPPATYDAIARPPTLPPRHVPKRPSYTTRESSGHDTIKVKRSPLQHSSATFASTLSPPPVPVGPHTTTSYSKDSRTPSPEKKGGMLRTLRSGGKERSSSSKMASTLRTKPPAAAKAATQAWGTLAPRASVDNMDQTAADVVGTAASSTVTTWDPYTRRLVEKPASPERSAAPPPVPVHASSSRPANAAAVVRPPSPADYFLNRPEARRQGSGDVHFAERGRQPAPYPEYPVQSLNPLQPTKPYGHTMDDFAPHDLGPPDMVSLTSPKSSSPANNSRLRKQSPARLPKLESLPSYRKEYPAPAPSKYTKPPNARPPKSLKDLEADAGLSAQLGSTSGSRSKPPPPIPRKALGVVSATNARRALDTEMRSNGHSNAEDSLSSGVEAQPKVRRKKKVADGPTSANTASSSRRQAPTSTTPILADTSSPPDTSDTDDNTNTRPAESDAWTDKVAHLLKNLPKGTDEAAAKQILNEIVIQGDEVHWSDVAGLDIAKSALKETVVYPFLRPDLFMGLREPARGMLLFGPPGTGKTMLARAVATESKSTFFAISASSLTSKYLGESEKLVRALFTIAKALAPSIIFVDEIDSLLSSRGGSSEHEATRRIKTEFLIQWSDLAKAAAGREATEGDASRVLVLAATNLPWAIDEAARRRFVRRQYIPLPEGFVRREQLITLMAAQKHSLGKVELDRLVARTDGKRKCHFHVAFKKHH